MNDPRPTTFSAPLGSVTNGLLELTSGTSNLTLHAAAPAAYREAEVLAEGVFGERAPSVRVDGGRVRLGYARPFTDFDFSFGLGFAFGLGLGAGFDWRRIHADVGLSTRVPWDLVFRGGVSGLRADLTALRLANLEIMGGVSDARLRLGRPSGTVRLYVLGGISQLEVERPADAALQVQVLGGASQLSVDTLHLGAIGGRFQWESPDFATATDRYILEIHGGVSDARVRQAGPVSVREPVAACAAL